LKCCLKHMVMHVPNMSDNINHASCPRQLPHANCIAPRGKGRPNRPRMPPKHDNGRALPPIKLISPTPDHKGLVLEPEGLQALREIAGEVAVVTIVGPQRGGEPKIRADSKHFHSSDSGWRHTGKSTLLNLLHHRSPAGFGVGHKMEASPNQPSCAAGAAKE